MTLLSGLGILVEVDCTRPDVSSIWDRNIVSTYVQMLTFDQPCGLGLIFLVSYFII